MIKKAMILAAGFGKRVHPLTLKNPKPLLRIGDETLLSNTLKFLELNEIKEVVINVHYLGEQIIHYIQNNKFNSSFIDYIAATYACKAAVKAGDKLEDDECVELIDKLFSTKHPYYCPHGRPIVVNLTINE